MTLRRVFWGAVLLAGLLLCAYGLLTYPDLP